MTYNNPNTKKNTSQMNHQRTYRPAEGAVTYLPQALRSSIKSDWTHVLLFPSQVSKVLLF